MFYNFTLINTSTSTAMRMPFSTRYNHMKVNVPSYTFNHDWIAYIRTFGKLVKLVMLFKCYMSNLRVICFIKG